MNKLKSILKRVVLWWKKQSTRTKVASIGGFVVLLILVLSSGNKNTDATVETVKRQNLVRTVSASGTVVSATDLSLSFESSKVVDSVRVSVGSKVKRGDILATQKNASERASYQSARGVLLAAEARYAKVLDGSSNEEIALAKIKLETTKKTQDGLVENARRKLYSDGLVAEPEGGSSALTTPTISGTYIGAEGSYIITADTNTNKRVSYGRLEVGEAEVSTTMPQRLGTKGLTILFPTENISSGSSWTVRIPNVNGTNYVSNLNSYQAALENRDAAVATAQAELDLKRATARQSEIDGALADIVSARGGLESAQAQLEKTILRAPSDGTITKVSVKVGEVPLSMKEAIVLQDVANLYLEADVNETGVPLLALGQPVTVTFDAFGPGKTYQASVSSIDPSATITDGIVNYRIKALLTGADDIRPGMTANMTVRAGEVQNVLALPSRAVEKRDGLYYVKLVTDERRMKTQERAITVGMRGDGDLLEITSGLAEGDKVVWGIK
jgi:HlyD family secretion protein